MNVSRGIDFEGGHLTDAGLDPGGAVITVPTHRHDVALDFTRVELVATYRFNERLSAWVRAPYDVKQRTAKIELVDPATPTEIAAMQANLDIHHPSATLEGFSDFSVLLAREAHDVFFPGDGTTVAFGLTLPVGRTEEDPYVLGDSGEAHEHVQFGTGTFDPLLEVYYSAPLVDELRLTANAGGRFPLYENSKGYEGPVEVNAVVALKLAVNEHWNLRAGWSSLYQGYAYWDDVRDVNTGLVDHGVVAGASYALRDDMGINLDVRVPVSQRTLGDGDTFEPGILVQLGLSYWF